MHQQSPEQCEQTLRVLKRRYTIIPLEQALAALSAGTFAQLPMRPLLLTFDDGRDSNAALIPIFGRHGVRPTVFVVTGLVGTNRHFWWTHLPAGEVARLQEMPDDERIAELTAIGLDPLKEFEEPQALSLEQLKNLAKVADIGPHTRMHPMLTSCTPERIREEVAGSAAAVERMLGAKPRVFAYPNGAFSDEAASAVAECGLRFAMTTEPVLVRPDSDPLRLGRIFVRDEAGKSELIVFASGLQGALKRLLRPSR